MRQRAYQSSNGRSRPNGGSIPQLAEAASLLRPVSPPRSKSFSLAYRWAPARSKRDQIAISRLITTTMAPNAGQDKPAATPAAPSTPAVVAAQARGRDDAATEHSDHEEVTEVHEESSDESEDDIGGKDAAPDSGSASPRPSEGNADEDAHDSREKVVDAKGTSDDGHTSPQSGGTPSATLRLVPSDTSGWKRGSARPLTTAQAQTLQVEGVLPKGPDAHASTPAQYVPSPVMASDSIVRIVGFPATQEHLDAGLHTQNGYGGLEVLLPMEGMGVGDIARLDSFFEPSDNPHDVVLVPRPEPLSEEELDRQMRSLDLQREVASVITEFSVPNLAQRVVGTVSLLRRLAIERQLMDVQLGQDSSGNARDAVAARGEVVRLELALKVQAEHFERRFQTLTSNREYTSQEFKEDLRLMMEEHERNVAGLKEQVASLTRALDDATVHRQSLERQLRQARFDSGEVMNFLNDNARLMLHWPRLLGLLKHFQDGTSVPSAWNTMITVTALDDPTGASGVHTRQDRSDEGEQQENGPPPPAVDLTGDTASEVSRESSSKRPRFSSGRKRTSGQASLQTPSASDELQEAPSKWDETSYEGCRSAQDKLALSETEARYQLANFPIAWDDLRLDVQMIMRAGIGYTGALQWIGEDRKAHTLFHMDPLLEMLVRMMYWGRLDSVFWTNYVPRRYFKAARSKVDELLSNKIEPPAWGDLVVQTDEMLDAEEHLLEPDDKSKDADWQVGDQQLDDDVDKLLDDSPSKRTRKKSKLRLSDSPSRPSKPSKRVSSGGEATTLVQKDFSKLTLREITLIERPASDVNSWLHYGVRMIHSPPSARAPTQTPGFPSYAPNRHDFDLLYARFDAAAYEELLDACPWDVMYAKRELRLFFHKRSELTKQDRAGIQEWLEFMLEKTRALWEWLHWVPFQPDSSFSKAFQQEHSQRISRHDSLRKAVDSKKKKLARKWMKESLFHEPGLWTFPVKICSWILMHPKHLAQTVGRHGACSHPVGRLHGR